MKKLENKVAIITGASKGLGLEIAKKYYANGAKLAICSRSIDDLKSVRNFLEGIEINLERVFIAQVDVSKYDEVSYFSREVIEKFGRIDVLVNNAGIYGPKGCFESCDMDEWVKTIEVNLIGSANVIRSVLPVMKAQKKGKIIQIAGGGAATTFPRFSAYATSKVGVVRLSEVLADELKEFNVDINSIAPGFLNTRLLDEVLNSDPGIVGQNFYEKCLAHKKSEVDSFRMPAELSVFLATEESDGITGKFISAIWDAWKLFPSHLSELMDTDVYTLRRIIGKDRNREIFDL